MILGTSHITLTCANLQRGITDLERVGYRVEFTDLALPSDPSKGPLLSSPWDTHAVAFARANRGLPIELVCYGPSVPEPSGSFIGLFERPAIATPEPEPQWPRLATAAAAAFNCSPTAGVIQGFAAPAFYVNRDRSAGGLAAAVLVVKNIKQSRRLWCNGLGFRETKTGEGWVRLDFMSPVAAWCFALLLVEAGETAPVPCLDGRGMTCLSFVCSSIEHDRKSLIENGATGARPFRARVNGKTLHIEILRGINGEFIELLQVAV